MQDRPRYYQHLDFGTVFRIVGAGVYAKWDSASGTWVHVTSTDVRSLYSRAVEGGDAWPLGPADIDSMGILVGAPMTEQSG